MRNSIASHQLNENCRADVWMDECPSARGHPASNQEHGASRGSFGNHVKCLLRGARGDLFLRGREGPEGLALPSARAAS